MTNILFRGKQMISGSWVEGDLFHNDNELFPMTMIGHVICSRNKHDGTIDFDGYDLREVDPETVGQYTGLMDKNGKRIFEGDVFTDADNECVGVVRFHNGAFKIFWFGQDGMMIPNGYDECAGQFGLLDVETFDDVYIDQMEVVGNIHDNPELLR